MVCDFDDAANRARDVGVQYEGGLRGGGGEQGGGGGGGVQGGAVLVLLAEEYELLLGWLSLVSLLKYICLFWVESGKYGRCEKYSKYGALKESLFGLLPPPPPVR